MLTMGFPHAREGESVKMPYDNDPCLRNCLLHNFVMLLY